MKSELTDLGLHPGSLRSGGPRHDAWIGEAGEEQGRQDEEELGSRQGRDDGRQEGAEEAAFEGEK